MLRALLLLPVLLTALGPQVAAAQAPPVEVPDGDEVADAAFYEVGTRLEATGRWQDALTFWEGEARRELGARDVQDPRIAYRYLEIVLAREDTARFGNAAELMLWSLEPPLVDGAREAVEAEVDRLLLIATEEEAALLRELRDGDAAPLLRELRRFWIERDPTPTTPRNERLEEHWRRILHSRREFVNANLPPLGADERGHVYVRFGAPERVRGGTLGASDMELQVRVPSDSEARQRLRRYDTNPQYEVWVYDDLNEEGFTYFLFGNVDGTGPFRLVDGVHELIPTGARSRASARYTPGGIPASYYLELFYYQDLSHVGGHFGRRFSEMDQLWNGYTYARRSFGSGGRWAPQESEVEALTFRYRQEDEFFPPNPPTVNVVSEFEGRSRDELVAQLIRTLSDDGVPVLVAVGASAPRMVGLMPDLRTSEMDVPEWVMRHTLIIRDRRLEEVGRLVQPLSATRADLSAFVLRHVDEPLHLTLTARTLRISGDAQEDTLVAGDRLPGQVAFTPGEPLSTDTTRLEMSDLLTGTLVPPEIDASALPYPLLPARKIWIRDPLRVYLELFHMAGDEEGFAVLDASFRVVPLTEDGEDDEDRDPVTLNVTLTPRAARPYRESFDMQLRDQEPGRYRLEVRVRDRIRGDEKLRTTGLELVR
ncbi:MAG TPA: GWxTD domain-containing protein [Longimicrobiales bacterium]|nr:GWxTD domain-containing protein [Longimicrobiales bacterium]